MGVQFLDQYSLLHFSSGVVAYNFGIPFIHWFVIHLGFELGENTEIGMKFINQYLTFWPGGKPRKDEPINVLGDNLSAIVGWYSAKLLDDCGKKQGWYKP